MIIGVTGKIASGKTEVMKILAKKGFHCIYADKVVRDLYENGRDGAKRIEEVFGDEYLLSDGSVDRIKLRNLVYNDEKELGLLNKTIHPLVFDCIKTELDEITGNVAIESVYFDSDFFGGIVDKILWIERSEDKIIDVLVKDRGFSLELAKKTVDFINKGEKVDFVIKNDCSLLDLEKRIDKIKI